MSETVQIDYLLTLNIEQSYSQIRKLEIALMKILNIASRLTGDENLKRGIETMQKTITVLRNLQMAYMALQAARMAAGDPLAWISAGATVVSMGFSMSDMMQM